MSLDAEDFILKWLGQNISFRNFELDGSTPNPTVLAQECRSAAADRGVSEQEFDLAIATLVGANGDVASLITMVIEDVIGTRARRPFKGKRSRSLLEALAKKPLQ